ncbi:MAG: hypothetical protein Ct9H90mP22_3680 [Gammaproteobacteria bacterium]|nr:MAG: hypothetical protein Ct9H90mP22_3680 [Gammaproteobacteria bacterium]
MQKKQNLLQNLLLRKELICFWGRQCRSYEKNFPDTALDNGVEVLGISLKSLHALELANPRLKEIVVADTLFDRKDEFMASLMLL